MCKSIPIGTELNCSICGTSYISITTARPKEYCSDNCRDFNKYLNATERHLLKIDFQGRNSNQIKGVLFRIANLVKCKK